MLEYITLLEHLREKKPLVHHITNYVTVNDCANITLAIGGSPVMADEPDDAADIAGIADALVLNMGTLNSRTIPAMLRAGKIANQKGTPVVFDPVGVGASKLRNVTASLLLRDLKLSIVRGNISEIRCLAGLQSTTKGVDASSADLANTQDSKSVAKDLALKLGCVVAITGVVDVVSDGNQCISIFNGVPMLGNLTGTGCMCSSLMGSYLGANPDKPLESAVAALFSMGISGEIAYQKAGSLGNGSFRAALHDAMSQLDSESLEKWAKFESK
ncbi:MAG: hydroxyethylthiazole kinase [Lachnospiraceae bacterium]|jgi:hydroxyethylthiazole kinase|nr:hydroxyethylthiazole kinase [Lachnospiraceae bacterium]